MALLPSHFSSNDAILFASLLYSCFDIACDWESFHTCYRPIHMWLLVSYATVISFRVMHIMGTRQEAVEGGHFLLNLRQKGTLSSRLFALTWMVAVPAFVLWTMVGSWWLWEIQVHSPNCMPEGALPWFVILWQVLSYAWIFVHLALGITAWVLERRLRNAESNLHELADADLISRWGASFTQLPTYGSLPSSASSGRAGLSPQELRAMAPPEEWVGEAGSECAICLNEIEPGESVRRLGGCGHPFHRSCIDLWLLRRADCPLCKCDARSALSCSPCSSAAEVPTDGNVSRRRTAAAIVV